MNGRIFAALATVLALGLAGGLAWKTWGGSAPSASSPSIGGPFTLVDTQGRAVSERSLLGKPTVIFFGFTYCPEVCPTTLTELTAAMRELGPAADRLNVVFVTIDPERDTPQQLKLYLSNFDPRIQGYTGTPEQVARIAKAYRVYYAKVPQPGGSYTMDHSSMVYLFDRNGRFVQPIAWGSPHERVTTQLRDLLSSR